MARSSSSTLYLLIFLSVLIRTSAHHAEHCINTKGNFTWNSPYAKNRDTIIGSLTEKVSANGGSCDTSTGQSPNTIYVLSFCQIDDAGEIVSSVARDLVEECPNQKAAFSWGTGSQPCFIRYSDTPIYGILQTQPTLLHESEDNITMSPAIWSNLTSAVMNQAMDGRSKFTFAKGQATLPDSRLVYSLLQCSFDLSANNCRSCLDEAIAYHDEHDSESQSSGVFNPSCIIRWALSPFPSPSSPAAPPASGGSISKGTLRLSSWK